MNARSYIIALMYTVYITLYSSSAFAVIGLSQTNINVSESAGSVTYGVVFDDPCVQIEACAFISVDYAFTDGTATGGQDYLPDSGTLNWDFNTNITPQTLSISIVNDGYFENDETINLTLSNCVITDFTGFQSACSIDTANGTITIINDDPPPVVALDSNAFTVSEGNQVTVTIIRSNNFGTISVDYATTDGSAIAGQDYTPQTGTLTWADGESGIKTITLATLSDIANEPDETFNVSLSNPQGGASLGTPSTATITVQNVSAGIIGPFETLCGTTLFADTKIENTTETVYGDCEIYIADGYKLTILNSNITVYEELKIQGEAGSLTIKGCRFDASDIKVRTESGDIIIKNNNDFYANKSYDAEISIETNSGNIAVKDNEFHIISDSEAEMEFQSNTGNIEVLDNTFVSSTSGSSLNINTYSGLINFKGNTINSTENMHVTVFGYGGGPVKIVENAGYIYDDLRLETNGADIALVENNFDENVHSLNIDSDGGNINVVGNDIPVSDNLGVISNGGKIDIVKNNFYSPYLIVINSEGGACKTAMNNPVLTCVAP